MVPTQSINIMDEQSMMTQTIIGFSASLRSVDITLSASSTTAEVESTSVTDSLSCIRYSNSLSNSLNNTFSRLKQTQLSHNKYTLLHKHLQPNLLRILPILTYFYCYSFLFYGLFIAVCLSCSCRHFYKIILTMMTT